MVNDPNLIEKIISQINNLTFEELDDAIKEVDEELNYSIEIDAVYSEKESYQFNEKILNCNLVHKKFNLLHKIFRKNNINQDKKENKVLEAA